MWFHVLLLFQARQIRKRFDYLRKLFSQGIYDRLHDASLGGRKRGADEVNAITTQTPVTRPLRLTGMHVSIVLPLIRP
jgi:hypothetical protein